MEDLDLFKDISRAVANVANDTKAISAAVAKVRALFVSPEPVREESAGHDRKERAGRTRSAE